MKNVIQVICLILVSTSAFATSPELTPENSGAGQASSYSGGAGGVSIVIDGDAARILFQALQVVPESNFGLVQTQTKKTNTVECEQAILGDVPGTMSGPRFRCTILVNNK